MTRTLLCLAIIAVTASGGTFRLVSDTLTLDVGTYRYISFRVTPEQSEGTVVRGIFETSPEGTPVELILLTEWNYLTAWSGTGSVDTLAVRHEGPGEVVMPVPDYGDYVLVVSNRGNFAPVDIYAELEVAFEGSGTMYDSLPTGMTLLMTVLAAALVITAVILAFRKYS